MLSRERLEGEVYRLEALDTKRSRAEAAVLRWVLGWDVVGPVEAATARRGRAWMLRMGRDLGYERLGDPLVGPQAEVATVADCRP